MALADVGTVPTSEELSPVVAYLQSVSPAGQPINKKDVRLEVLGHRWPRLVPLAWTLRREAPRVYTYGIVGQSLADAGGFAKRGSALDDVPGSALIIDLLEFMCRSKKVFYRVGVPTLQHLREVERLEVFMVPIVDDDEIVVSFLNFTRYFWGSPPRFHFP